MEKKTPELILRSYVCRFIDEDDGKSFVMNDADSNVVVSAMKHYATQETKPLQERIDELVADNKKLLKALSDVAAHEDTPLIILDVVSKSLKPQQ